MNFFSFNKAVLFCSAVCPNLITLNESTGVITSPFYPRRYQNNHRCRWQIAASKGKRVKLVIEDIRITQCGSSCRCDYLEVQNGSIFGDGAPNGRMCGYLMGNITYYSFHERLTVLFVSNVHRKFLGFKATYT